VALAALFHDSPALTPFHWSEMADPTVRVRPNPAPGSTPFALARRTTRLKTTWLGRGIGLSYSLRRIVVNGSFSRFCRFHHWRGQPPSRGRQLLFARGPHSVGRRGDMRRGWSAPLGPALPKAGGNSKWQASPRRRGIFPECVVVVRAFLSHEKPTGVYK
jgi:hypothetical protein